MELATRTRNHHHTRTRSHHQGVQSMKGSSLERTQRGNSFRSTKGNRAHLEALFSILSWLQWSSRHSGVQPPLTQNFMTSRILALSTKNFAKSTCGFSPLFACLMSRTFSANEQCFFLTTNQRTILFSMPYQPNEADGSQCTASFGPVVFQLV